MSTGGLSLLIAAQPHTFPGLRSIGLTIYILNILLFTLVTTLLLTRFILYPRTFRQSITHKREAFFVPTFFLSLATLITSTQRYAVPDPEVSSVPAAPSLLWAIQTAFWIYLVLTTILAIAQYSHIFTAHRFGLHTMMPTWILPIFPIMLSGTIASVIAGTQPAEQAVAIITAGLTCQGLGLSVAVMMYAHMVGRLMTSGLPDREHRPGLFMCVGPPAFTALAFLGLSRSLPANFDVDDDGFLDTSGIRTTAIIGAGYLWALSFWWFGIAVIAVAIRPPRYFHLGWWATVFPNIGFVLATISLGKAFKNETVLWFATVVSVGLVGVYLFVLGSHVRAVVVQDIMYPGRDEDVEDH
ncbi:C4-dicarboxylate transporter/malic acid transport protein [Echria macrotheca]|uniref:C4-dicarboxylate transporter/malic acid transport protein n=1 Tax=Echria macrotheca TaxID=438768 RepID=A0AAJ0BDW8_9PEZI|nr:C4-dicarboxylate transporter/malic acid transport protein [Echria macrotheca]